MNNIHTVHTDIARVINNTNSSKRKIKTLFSTQQLEYLHAVFPEASLSTPRDNLDVVRGQRSVIQHIASLIEELG